MERSDERCWDHIELTSDGYTGGLDDSDRRLRDPERNLDEEMVDEGVVFVVAVVAEDDAEEDDEDEEDDDDEEDEWEKGWDIGVVAEGVVKGISK